MVWNVEIKGSDMNSYHDGVGKEKLGEGSQGYGWYL